MAVDVTSMTASVRTRMGSPTTDGFFTDAMILDMLNEALMAIATEGDWPWLQATTTFTTVAGTATYDPTVATNWMKTRALTIDGYDSMQLLNFKEIREKVTSAQGTPEFYAVFNELINLRPVPNAVFTVIHDYYKYEPLLVNPGDQPILPAQFRMAIVEYAVYLAHMRQSDTSRYSNSAAAALSSYKDWLMRMADHRRRTTGGVRIRVRPGSGL